jgi:hypothetical protein
MCLVWVGVGGHGCEGVGNFHDFVAAVAVLCLVMCSAGAGVKTWEISMILLRRLPLLFVLCLGRPLIFLSGQNVGNFRVFIAAIAGSFGCGCCRRRFCLCFIWADGRDFWLAGYWPCVPCHAQCLRNSQYNPVPYIWGSRRKWAGLIDSGMGRWCMGTGAWLFLLLVVPPSDWF